MQPPDTTTDFIKFTLIRHASEIYDEEGAFGTEDETVAWLSSFRNIAEEHDIDYDGIVRSECLESSIKRMNTLVRSYGRSDLEVELYGNRY